MIKITIQKITEYDETASCYKDPQSGKLYDNKYDVERTIEDGSKLSEAQSKEIWDRCEPHRRPTGKKLSEAKEIYSQVLDQEDNESKVIDGIVKAANRIEK